MGHASGFYPSLIVCPSDGFWRSSWVLSLPFSSLFLLSQFIVAVIVSPCRVQRIWPLILSPLALNSSLRYCLLSIRAHPRLFFPRDLLTRFEVVQMLASHLLTTKTFTLTCIHSPRGRCCKVGNEHDSCRCWATGHDATLQQDLLHLLKRSLPADSRPGHVPLPCFTFVCDPSCLFLMNTISLKSETIQAHVGQVPLGVFFYLFFLLFWNL